MAGFGAAVIGSDDQDVSVAAEEGACYAPISGFADQKELEDWASR
jgi:hypothetical protein